MAARWPGNLKPASSARPRRNVQLRVPIVVEVQSRSKAAWIRSPVTVVAAVFYAQLEIN